MTKLNKKQRQGIESVIELYQAVLDNIPLLPELDTNDKKHAKALLTPCISKVAYDLMKGNQATLDGLQSDMGVIAIREAVKRTKTSRAGINHGYESLLTDKDMQKAVDSANSELMLDVMTDKTQSHLTQSDVDNIDF